MTDKTWIVDTDGSWSTAANWSMGTAPASGDDVTIDTSDPHTITYDGGADEVNSLSVHGDDFAISGGTLTVDNGAIFDNALSLSGGSLVLGSGSSNSVIGLLTNSGTISVKADATLTLSGGGTLGAGSLVLSDDSAVDITGGSYALDAGTIVTGTGTLIVEGGSLVAPEGDIATLATAVQFGGNGTAFLSGAGTIATTDGVDVADEGSFKSVVLTGGVTWSNSGTIMAAGSINLGFMDDDSATLLNTADGTFDLTTDDAYINADFSGAYLVNNQGLLAKTGGTGTSSIYAAIDNSGTIEADTGILELAGGGTLGGTIGGGDGTVEVEGTYSADDGVTTSVIFSTGAQLGGYSKAIFSGPGTIATSGAATVADLGSFKAVVLTGGVTWSNSGTIMAAGSINLGFMDDDSATLLNTADGIFDLTTDDAYINADFSGTYLVNNEGLLAKTGGTGTSSIYAAIDNSGTIEADTGLLELAGGGTLGGTIGGGDGTVEVEGTYSAGDGITTSVVFSTGAQLAGYNKAIFSGPGTIATSGAATVADLGSFKAVVLTSGVTWSNSGTIDAGGSVNLGFTADDSATLLNTADGIFDLTTDDAYINADFSGTYLVNNQGLLAKTGGTGISAISPAIDNSGTIEVDTGTLELADGTFGGEFKVTGALLLTGESTFDGLTIVGAGTATNSRSVDQTGTVTIGDDSATAASFANSGTYTLNGNSDIAVGAGAASGFVNSGTLTMEGDGTSTISAVFTNTDAGTVDVDDGALAFDAAGNNFDGSIVGPGTLAFTGGSDTLASGIDLSVAGMSLSGGSSVTLGGDLSFGGTLVAEAGTTLSHGAHTLTLSGESSTFAGAITGTGALVFDGGSGEFDSGATFAANTISLQDDADVAFDENLNYGKTFSMSSDSTLAVGTARTLDLSAKSTLAGTIVGPGTLQIDGTASLGKTTLQSGQLKNTGTINQSGELTLGNGNVTNQATHHWNVVAGTGIDEAPIADNLFTNAGFFTKTDNSGEAAVTAAFVDTGSVAVTGGTLRFSGRGNSFAGAITGKGTIEFSSGSNSSFNTGASVAAAGWKVDSNADVTVSTNLTYGGAFSIGSGSSLTIASGKTLTMSGSFNPAGGQMNGAGALLTTGTGQVNGVFSVGGTAAWQNSGTLTLSQEIFLASTRGSGPAFINQAKGTVNITGGSAFQLSPGLSTAAVENLGLIEKTGSSALAQISPNFTDTGTISIAKGTLEFDGKTNSFAGKINGAGTVAFAAGTNTLQAGIGGTIANVVVENSGTKLVLSANAAFTGNFTQNKGTTVTLGNAVLTLGGSSASLAGTIGGTGAASGLTLKAGSVTLASGFALQSKNWTIGKGVSINDALSFTYAGKLSDAGTISLGAKAILTLTGGTTFTAATVAGGGLTTKGATKVQGLTLLGSKWLNYGTVTATSSVTSGTPSGLATTIVNEAKAVINLAGNVGLSFVGKGTLTNAGTLEKTGGAGLSTVTGSVANKGAITASAGTLDFAGAITGTGTIAVSKGATVEFGGAVAKTQTITFGAGGGHLALGNAKTFAAAVKGFSGAGDTIDIFGGTGSATESYKENAQKTGGTLTITQGSSKASITLFGQYVASGFHLAQTPSGAVELTYTPPKSTHLGLAANHG
jgi:hypothetical protein